MDTKSPQSQCVPCIEQGAVRALLQFASASFCFWPLPAWSVETTGPPEQTAWVGFIYQMQTSTSDLITLGPFLGCSSFYPNLYAWNKSDGLCSRIACLSAWIIEGACSEQLALLASQVRWDKPYPLCKYSRAECMQGPVLGVRGEAGLL